MVSSMTEITRVFNAETRSLTNAQRRYSGQQFDSLSTTLHFEYDPIDFLSADSGVTYIPYIMFDVYVDTRIPVKQLDEHGNEILDRYGKPVYKTDDDGNVIYETVKNMPLIYGPESTPKFDGYTFSIPWDVTSRIKSQRVEYQLYFISSDTSFHYNETTNTYYDLSGTTYILSSKDGIAIKPSIGGNKRCGCNVPLMAPTTEPTVTGYINLWKQRGLIEPIRTEYDESTEKYTLIFTTFNGDEYPVEMAISTFGLGKLTAELTANKKVGGVEIGTTYRKGTSLEDIIRDMLYREPHKEDLLCMYGAVTGIPSDSTGLVQDESDEADWDNFLGQGWTVRIITGEGDGEGQHAVVAVSNILVLTSWVATDLPMFDLYSTGNVGVIETDHGYRLYYLKTLTYDADLSPPGTEYLLKFKEEYT